MPKHARSRLRILPLAILTFVQLVAAAGSASAQLADALWTESVSIQANLEFGGQTGSDNSKPENVTGTLDGTDYTAMGSVHYTPSLVPAVTCEASTNYQSGALDILTVDTFANVIWEFVVVESASGGPSVSSVPINVIAQGSAAVIADAASLAAASASFEIRYLNTGVAVVYETIVANNVGGGTPLSDSFAVSGNFALPIGEVFRAMIMTGASSRASFDQGAAVGSGTGYVDPVIEVADELIPGTSESYRDYYQVEFS
jgi:hypothetical protein